MVNMGGDKVIPVRVSWDKYGMEYYKYNNKITKFFLCLSIY